MHKHGQRHNFQKSHMRAKKNVQGKLYLGEHTIIASELHSVRVLNEPGRSKTTAHVHPPPPPPAPPPPATDAAQ